MRMGKLRYIFWEETKRTLGNRTFLALIIAVIFLCMLMPIGKSDNTMTNSFIILFFMNDKAILQESGLVFSSVTGQITGAYFHMFMPLIVGLTVLPVLSEDWESGRSRYVLIKCGKIKMLIGKLLSACISGGFVMFCGYFFMAIVLYAKLEHDIVFWTLAASYGGVFVHGAVCAIWCFLVSGIVRNPYLLACIPYIFLWFVERKINSLNYQDLEENKVLLVIASMVNYIESFFYDSKVAVRVLIFYTMVAVLAIGLHLFMMKRRVDCGQ